MTVARKKTTSTKGGDATRGKGIALSDITTSLKVDPKLARRRLRRAMPNHKGSWVFPSAKRAEVVKIIKP